MTARLPRWRALALFRPSHCPFRVDSERGTAAALRPDVRGAASIHSLLLATSLLACGGPEPQDLPRLNRWSDSGFFLSHRAVWVLVVDDGPAAGGLREAVAGGLVPHLEHSLHQALAWHDPGAWSEVDWTVVLAFPSAAGPARFVGPSEVPALQIRTLRTSPNDIQALAEAARAEIEARVAPGGAPYRPLEALADIADLLAGKRPPEDADELAVARAALDARGASVALLSTRDDASPLAPEHYARALMRLPLWLDVALVPAAPAERCDGSWMTTETIALGSPRLVAFAREANIRISGVRVWPCDAPAIAAEGPFGRIWADGIGTGFCPDRPIARDASGLPRCRAYARIDPSRGCDPTRGWRDPEDRADGERRPRVEPSFFFSGRARVCEIARLEGNFARICAASPACEGCPSGFCLADKDLVGPGCAGRAALERARFVGGAAEGSDALVEIVCLLDQGEAP